MDNESGLFCSGFIEHCKRVADSSGSLKKGPLGLRPRWVWHECYRYPNKQNVEERIAEIEQAMARYREAGYVVPLEWRKELSEIQEVLKNNF